MIDVKTHIKYWIESASDDLETAIILINNKKYLHGLFFCHLTIEKSLKAAFVSNNGTIPPKSHNLFLLSGKSNINFDEKDEIFLGVLMKYQLEGRYPDYKPIIPDFGTIINYYNKTKEIFEWIRTKL